MIQRETLRIAIAQDAALTASEPDLPMGGSTTLTVSQGNDFSLLQAGLSALAKPVSLSLYVKSQAVYTPGEVTCHAVLQSWGEYEATWNNRTELETWSAPGLQEGTDYRAAAIASASINEADSWYRWELTSLISEWFGGSLVNHGVVLRTTAESAYMLFYSANDAEESNRPYLELTFEKYMATSRSRSTPLGLASLDRKDEERFEFAGRGMEPISILDSGGAPVYCDLRSVRLFVNGLLWPTSQYRLEQGANGTILIPNLFLPKSPSTHCSVLYRPL